MYGNRRDEKKRKREIKELEENKKIKREEKKLQ